MAEMTEEQMAALQEKIKNMSPQELKEFQKKQCIFCQIIAGKIQAKKVYEDSSTIGILDINPANPGHILLLPKEHYAIMPQMPEDEISHIFIAAKHLSNAMLRSIEAQGTNIIVANGVAAGQRAQHFMLHIIPRKENDGVKFSLPQKTISESELESVGNAIISSLSGQQQTDSSEQKKEHVPYKKITEKNIHEKKHESRHSDEKQHVPHAKIHVSQKVGHSEAEKEESEESRQHMDAQSRREKKNDDDNSAKKSNDPKSGIDLDDIARLLGAK